MLDYKDSVVKEELYIIYLFSRIRKNCETRPIASSCLSVRLEQFGSHWTDFHEIPYFSIFRKSIGKVHVCVPVDIQVYLCSINTVKAEIMKTLHINTLLRFIVRTLEVQEIKQMNFFWCHLHHAPPHILCLAEHHTHYDELASLHVENYKLVDYNCRKTKHKGGVCMFIHNRITLTTLNTDYYCLD
jgi:hypothetical protein